MSEVLDKLRNKIIVSVQAQDNEPLNKPDHLLAMSQSVINGGASGLRLCGIENIKYIKKNLSVQVPIIGLTKTVPTPINWLDTVYISATLNNVKDLIKTGVEIISIDGTSRLRADKSTLSDQIGLIRKEKRIIMADVATYEEAMNASDLGAHLVSTTLSGYTRETRHKVNEGPDFELLAELIQECPVPIILEGRIWVPEQVKEAFKIGAYAVVIGTAITRPQLITKRFVSVMPN